MIRSLLKYIGKLHNELYQAVTVTRKEINLSYVNQTTSFVLAS